jgi:hypothetical protein
MTAPYTTEREIGAAYYTSVTIAFTVLLSQLAYITVRFLFTLFFIIVSFNPLKSSS